eukprot:Nk52_evm14s2630 gene=Nk52_evmTU14s2630
MSEEILVNAPGALCFLINEDGKYERIAQGDLVVKRLSIKMKTVYQQIVDYYIIVLQCVSTTGTGEHHDPSSAPSSLSDGVFAYIVNEDVPRILKHAQHRYLLPSPNGIFCDIALPTSTDQSIINKFEDALRVGTQLDVYQQSRSGNDINSNNSPRVHPLFKPHILKHQQQKTGLKEKKEGIMNRLDVEREVELEKGSFWDDYVTVSRTEYVDPNIGNDQQHQQNSYYQQMGLGLQMIQGNITGTDASSSSATVAAREEAFNERGEGDQSHSQVSVIYRYLNAVLWPGVEDKNKGASELLSETNGGEQEPKGCLELSSQQSRMAEIAILSGGLEGGKEYIQQKLKKQNNRKGNQPSPTSSPATPSCDPPAAFSAAQPILEGLTGGLIQAGSYVCQSCLDVLHKSYHDYLPALLQHSNSPARMGIENNPNGNCSQEPESLIDDDNG